MITLDFNQSVFQSAARTAMLLQVFFHNDLNIIVLVRCDGFGIIIANILDDVKLQISLVKNVNH